MVRSWTTAATAAALAWCLASTTHLGIAAVHALAAATDAGVSVASSSGAKGVGGGDLDARADAIVSAFSDDDIIGQMTQLDLATVLRSDATLDEDKVREHARARVGSYLNSPFSGGPIQGKYGWTASEWRAIVRRVQEISMAENGGHPVLFGIDSVHGATYVSNAVLFPHQLNGAASFNPALVREMGRVTGRDSAAAGLPWVFGPTLEIAQNPLWSRTFETFGEDPFLASVMADAIVRGLQSSGTAAACMKHFVGYSKTASGHDRDGVTISDFDLLNYFLPPFLAATHAGALSAMQSYASINGEPVVSSAKILRDLLRADMGFQGVMVSDWAEVNNLHDWHRVAKSTGDAVRLALSQTTLDMSMVPYDTSFIEHAKSALRADPALLPRLRDSARRVVKMKLQLGLYDDAVPGAGDVAKVGGAEDEAAALELARESIVLLQNKDGALPIASPATPVFLTGHSADNVGHLCGGWSVRCQGYSGNEMFPHGVSVKQGLERIAGASAVTFFNGLAVDGSYSRADMETAKAHARAAEYTVVVVGEASYAEKPGDIDDLALPEGQVAYVRELAQTGAKVVLVLVGGRPRLLDGLAADVHAVIDALLPCELGGQALAEIIYGRVNPSGRLPMTYPKHAGNILIPYNHRVSTRCVSGACEPEWHFGAGLSYTTFAYSALTLSKTAVAGSRDSLTVSVTVTNSGPRAGKETVMLFVTQPYRAISEPEVKRLRKFAKVSLAPGASSTVEFTLTAADWSVFAPQIGRGLRQVAEDGEFVVAVKPETDCDVYGAGPASNPLCATFVLSGTSAGASDADSAGAGEGGASASTGASASANNGSNKKRKLLRAHTAATAATSSTSRTVSSDNSSS